MGGGGKMATRYWSQCRYLYDTYLGNQCGIKLFKGGGCCVGCHIWADSILIKKQEALLRQSKKELKWFKIRYHRALLKYATIKTNLNRGIYENINNEQ